MREGKTSRNGIIYCYASRGGSKYHDRWIDKSLCDNQVNDIEMPALKRKALSLAERGGPAE
jgi:hypothetical protein